jgi:hypothetical protein
LTGRDIDTWPLRVHALGQDNPKSFVASSFLSRLYQFCEMKDPSSVVATTMDELAQSNLIQGTPKKDKPALQR